MVLSQNLPMMMPSNSRKGSVEVLLESPQPDEIIVLFTEIKQVYNN